MIIDVLIFFNYTQSLLARRIKPLVDRVLVKKFVPPKKSSGGLYLPESAQRDEIPQVSYSETHILYLIVSEISNIFNI